MQITNVCILNPHFVIVLSKYCLSEYLRNFTKINIANEVCIVQQLKIFNPLRIFNLRRSNYPQKKGQSWQESHYLKDQNCIQTSHKHKHEDNGACRLSSSSSLSNNFPCRFRRPRRQPNQTTQAPLRLRRPPCQGLELP